jgi:hypothetical protein
LRLLSEGLGEPEIEDLQAAIGSEFEIGRLEVAVDD